MVIIVVSLLTSEAYSAPEVLIFGKTIRQIPHGEIIPPAGTALAKYFTKHGVHAEFSQDVNFFSIDNLKKYDSVVLLDVSEGIFSNEMKSALREYFKNGHGLLLIHASIAAGKDWPWLQDLLGAKFVDHAREQSGKVIEKESANNFFQGISTNWVQVDEWYNFSNQISDSAEVILLADETTYEGGKMGNVHPIAWRRSVQSGRFFYSAMGHSAALYSDETSPFLKFILQALKWTNGR